MAPNKCDSEEQLVSHENSGMRRISKRIRRYSAASTIVVFPVLVYLLTIYCAITSSYQYSPLGLVSPERGILILSVLSKLGDIVLAVAAEKLWEFISLLVVAGEVPASVSTIFTLSSSVGFFGLFDIAKQRKVKSSKCHNERWWALLRMIIMILLPGPGIFIMSEISVENAYFATQFSPISGGMGIFNASLIPICQQASGPMISGLVQSLLRDPSISYTAQPTSPFCEISNSSCTSYLLPGGVYTVSPWPVRSTSEEPLAYLIEDAPSYQLDYGSVSADVIWPSDACKMYATMFASKLIPLQLCIQNSTNPALKGQLLAAWRVCPTSLNEERDCNQPGSWEASQIWNTSLAVYRRHATVVASRTDMTLLEVKDLDQALLQYVSPQDLFRAYDAILTPLDQIDVGGNCSSLTPQSQLTQYLYIYLNQSAYTPNPSFNTPREYLRNLLATPLYLCNSVMLTSGSSPDDIQEGLSPQNYLRGSYTVPTKRAVVSSWTIWVYAALYGATMLLMLIVCVVVSGHEIPKSSHFPIADFLISMKPEKTTFAHDMTEAESIEILFEDMFSGIEPGNNRMILRRANEMKLRLAQGSTAP